MPAKDVHQHKAYTGECGKIHNDKEGEVFHTPDILGCPGRCGQNPLSITMWILLNLQMRDKFQYRYIDQTLFLIN